MTQTVKLTGLALKAYADEVKRLERDAPRNTFGKYGSGGFRLEHEQAMACAIKAVTQSIEERSAMKDIVQHLTRQAVFSKATFGPGLRTIGIIDHIKKETVEVEELASANKSAAPEWVDLVILSLDGLLRSIWEGGDVESGTPGHYYATADTVALIAAKMIIDKQGENERRSWPDWRTASPDKAIEHIRTEESERPF